MAAAEADAVAVAAAATRAHQQTTEQTLLLSSRGGRALDAAADATSFRWLLLILRGSFAHQRTICITTLHISDYFYCIKIVVIAVGAVLAVVIRC